MPSTVRIKRPRQALVKSQEADNLRRFQAAPATISGHFTREQLVTDSKDLYRVITHGVRYHEDASALMYGVKKIRATREWAATQFLRTCIGDVLRKGTHEPGSRGAGRKKTQPLPSSYNAELTWRDAKPGSLAMPDVLSVHGSCARVVRPNDDAPSIAWLEDAALCERIRASAVIAPTPLDVPVVLISGRTA